MRVVICDDHPVVVMGVKALLAGYGESLQVVGEANGGQQLLELLAKQPCDLVITDFSMPGKSHQDDGLNMLRRLRAAWPGMSIIVLTMVRNPALLQNMLKLGVQGIVDKAGMMTELLQAMQAVSAGRSYVSARHRAEVVGSSGRVDAKRGAPPKVLSAREAEVVRLYASGMSITQIAEATNRSVKTISKQKTDAMRKLGLESNHDLLEFARANGLK
jgi:two-component system, NarL family, captular synthesis response regulator RcsB